MTEIWGTSIAIYTFFAETSVGTYIISMLPMLFKVRELRDISSLALRLSWASIIAVLIPLLLHLGSPWRAYEIFISPNFSSPMTVGAWMIGLLIILITAIVILDNWYRATHALTITILGAAGLVPALIYAGYPGILLAVSKGVEAWWHNMSLPILSILIAVASGSALILLTYIILRRVSSMEINKTVLLYGSRVLLISLLLIFIIEITDLIVRTYEPGPGLAEFNKVLTGSLSLSYVGLQLFIGMIIPLIMLFLVLFNKVSASSSVMLAVSVLVLIGAFADRWNLIVGGELVDMVSVNVYRLGTFSIDLVEILASIFTWLFIISLSLVIFSNWKTETEVSEVKINV